MTSNKAPSNVMLKKIILNYLEKRKRITLNEANYNFHLSGGHMTKIISLLRQDGIKIKTVMDKNPVDNRRYATYHLIQETV